MFGQLGIYMSVVGYISRFGSVQENPLPYRNGTANRLKPRFTNRFYGGRSAIDGGLSYNHPTSKFTSLYIVTSTGGGAMFSI